MVYAVGSFLPVVLCSGHTLLRESRSSILQPKTVTLSSSVQATLATSFPFSIIFSAFDTVPAWCAKHIHRGTEKEDALCFSLGDQL
jgi:hypothetical protein